ncbi:MAG: Smr/MutS family protein [Desulfobacterota bacterium]|nr:Smr/MutS family protein [Thermodesulfobacteriota bacterium]
MSRGRKKGVNKYGIRQLSSNDDLAAHFLGEALGEEDAALFEAYLDPAAVRQAAKEKETAESVECTRLHEKLRQYPPPQEEIDLHGTTAAEAAARVRFFIIDAVNRGLKTVRIVTGKGLHSQRGAVLRDIVEQGLVELKRTGRILTFIWERQAKTRSGAVVVYLHVKETATV